MKQKKQLREGSINLPSIMSKIFISNGLPQYNEDYCRAILSKYIPELNDRDYCPNCGASMEEYIFPLDILDVLLIISMAKNVRNKTDAKVPFNQANQVHVPSLPTGLSVKCRTTICSKLGLVAKVNNDQGKHIRGVWLITARGWALLRGDKVPSMVKVFRGKIEERFEETTTIGDIIKGRKSHFEGCIRDKREIDAQYDFRKELDEFRASDWFSYGGHHQGSLINDNVYEQVKHYQGEKN